ncbi:hypothetical protein BDA99DRAFT_516172 [Phascolomyces articulosus]|uniref:Uncharacterized protein n=1 Tax=Phascolomyces articulosus TaxID=60185 RepID=A0AAD5PCF4_9FUNG|nr:hypothetical protein BDA99DRAFT_516172 [Phascolomyces articulosus]
MGFVSIPSSSSATEKKASASSRSYCHETSAQKLHASISFVRCLHQAKAIVGELENLHHSIDVFVTPSMISSIQAYLDTTFNKFIRLCKSLHILLERMYTQSYINNNRFESFKLDIATEWKRASHIRSATTHLLHHAMTRQQLQCSSPINHENNDNNNDHE